jgi:hypothetical protein
MFQNSQGNWNVGGEAHKQTKQRENNDMDKNGPKRIRNDETHQGVKNQCTAKSKKQKEEK